ncbi:MAG: NAD(P)H-dependent glycerol-3-phosphate dehydrogenase [Candidatus Absconditabacteria bacterium]|nr:NAD(P)H-dependent glycerol-3-phosphate dehydrogenase [Candidatus Absconditabacteria bacterium]MDD3868735.1 NAD(P)H-dependent glycerol-3-phosphate dehydrogenase [Candidatus Absconditabacteria bacterium]MDD4714766.1 NAD(P)H-dependent glycerol-3-phosphate dehydrogenase [Candidatus Absconditabacteria bacterium]
MSSPILILGAGSRGTALAQVVADTGAKVLLRTISDRNAKSINEKHINASYFSSHTLPLTISATTNLALAVSQAGMIIIALPSRILPQVIDQIAPYYTGQSIITATKGLYQSDSLLFSSLISEKLAPKKLAVISGPSHAEEVIKRLPTFVSLASEQEDFPDEVMPFFRTEYFRLQTNTDIIGTQLGGALKNVVALACGISDGLERGANIKSAIATKGLQEVGSFIQQQGGKKETVYGLAGIGDLLVTAMSTLSRNRKAGKYLAQGNSKEKILSELMDMEVESFSALKVLSPLLQEQLSRFPLLALVDEISKQTIPQSMIERHFLEII